jgi:DNA primase
MAKTLLEVLEENKLSLKESSGGRWVLSCPFHEGDEDPSLTVYPNQTYYCFACGAWGDAVKFLVEYKGLTHEEALAEVGIDHQFPKYKKSRIVKLRDVIGTWRFLGEATTKYHEYLKQTPGALNYLHSRGLNDQTIAKYKLGYTDGYVLKYTFAEEYARATEVGLLHKDGFELLSHRITIPNLLDRGEVDFITGRTVVNNRLKYLNTHGSKPIHGFFEIRKSPVVFLAEGQMDWLTLRQWEWPAAVMSGSHLTKSNQALLENKQLVLIPDNDEAGKKVVRSITDRYPNVTVLDFTEFGFKDISEFAQMKDAERIFTDLVREQCNWIFSLSSTTLNQWFKPLMRDVLFR